MMHRIVLLALLVMTAANGWAETVTLGDLTGGGEASASGVVVRGAICALAPPSGYRGPSQAGSYAVRTGFFAALGAVIARNGADMQWLELCQWLRPIRDLSVSSCDRWELETAALNPYYSDRMP